MTVDDKDANKAQGSGNLIHIAVLYYLKGYYRAWISLVCLNRGTASRFLHLQYSLYITMLSRFLFFRCNTGCFFSTSDTGDSWTNVENNLRFACPRHCYCAVWPIFLCGFLHTEKTKEKSTKVSRQRQGNHLYAVILTEG